jgi:hypothetical protein
MWIRKSDQQMATERSRLWLSFSGPAILFLVSFLACIRLALEGPRRPGQVSWPSTWSEILGGAAFMAAVVAIASYVIQLVRQRKIADGAKVDICNTCYRVRHRDGKSKCECGGTFDDFDHWTWIDDQSE